jgi:hypothetical protein
VSGGNRSLLTQIERDALDDSTSLAATLRKCIALGAQTRNADLRDWASQELDGYRNAGEVPGYRIIYVPLSTDTATSGYIATGQRIADISEKLELLQGVGTLQALVQNARSSGNSSVKMRPLDESDLLVLLNQINQSGQNNNMLYWDVSLAIINGVLDQIRTTLVRLVSEMRASMRDDSSTPSSEQAAQAVNFVLRGGRRNQVTVIAQNADDGATASVTTGSEQKESGWTKMQTIWTIIGVIVAIIALYIGYLQLHH